MCLLVSVGWFGLVGPRQSSSAKVRGRYECWFDLNAGESNVVTVRARLGGYMFEFIDRGIVLRLGERA